MKNFPVVKFLLKSLSYVLVAAVASAITLALFASGNTKLEELERVIDEMFVGSYDSAQIQDAAASAMVDALGDRWSYYMTEEEYIARMEDVRNAFVGIGVTIRPLEDGTGEEIIQLSPNGPAQEAGILLGDIITKVDGVSIAGMTTTETKVLVVGEEGTQVVITVLRGEEELDFTITRKTIQVPVATATLLDNNVGLIRIENFHDKCAQETIAAIEDLREQGATSLIFDVRYNPGGYVNEMVKVLDYLLPECVVFRQEDYKGNESTRKSDASCVEMPMAVLVNGDSYSAAEFFAACLREYDKAIVVGERTCGKGYYQNTLVLSDGSAVNLSTGKYFTPKGVNLTEVGGLSPDVPLAVDSQTAAKIYANQISPEEDPQVQAAVERLLKTAG